MNIKEIEQLHEVNNHLLNKILTLEIIVNTLYEELVESDTINEKSFNKRISKKIEKVNKELKSMQDLAETISSYSMFMSTKPGEA